MPVTVSWYDDTRTVVYLRYNGQWTWDEYHNSIREANALVGSVTQRVDAVSHALDKNPLHLPPGAFREWRKTVAGTPPNLGVIVLVPGSTFMQVMTDTFSRVVGEWFIGKLRVAKTTDEALALIQRLRAAQASGVDGG